MFQSINDQEGVDKAGMSSFLRQVQVFLETSTGVSHLKYMLALHRPAEDHIPDTIYGTANMHILEWLKTGVNVGRYDEICQFDGSCLGILWPLAWPMRHCETFPGLSLEAEKTLQQIQEILGAPAAAWMGSACCYGASASAVW